MKKKIISLCLVVILALTAIGGATLAYFSDTKAQTNTFTSGFVGITLNEAVVEENAQGNLVAKSDGSRTEGDQSYRLYPGMTVTKDPTITLSANSEDAYIAAKITIKGDLHDLYGVDPTKVYYNLDITQFVSGGLIQTGSTQGWNWNGLNMIYTDVNGNVSYQDASNGSNQEWVMYLFLKDAKKANDTIKLFETLTISKDYNNTEMAKVNGATVKVEAFAVQAHGFNANQTDATNCFNAMKAAFPEQFNIGTSTEANA